MKKVVAKNITTRIKSSEQQRGNELRCKEDCNDTKFLALIEYSIQFKIA